MQLLQRKQKVKVMKYAFYRGILLDGTKEMVPQKRKAILVDGQKIVDIVEDTQIPEGYTRIDLKGKYIMPGLINMHVHLAGNGGSGKAQKKKSDPTKLVEMLFSNPITAHVAYRMVRNYADIALQSGVTTVRTVGGLRDLDTRVRDEIAQGKYVGPRILAANEGISVPGGHMAGSVAIAAESIEEAKKLVEKAEAQHTDLIKLMITGGVLDAKSKGTPGELKMDPAMVKAVCAYAHEKGYYVAAHVESPEGVKVALENGVDSIEHGAALDEEMVSLFKEKHAYLTCTLSPAVPFAKFPREVSGIDEIGQYNGNIVFNGCVDAAKACVENNIPVALGNDVGCPWITQYDFYRELVYFHQLVGVSNAYALYSATLNNAQLAGIGDITGSITKGKDADMIVTANNPLDDLNALHHVDMVVARGNLIEHPHVKRNPRIDAQLDPYME